MISPLILYRHFVIERAITQGAEKVERWADHPTDAVSAQIANALDINDDQSSSLRYRFQLNPQRDVLISAIFARAFKIRPEEIILAAERAEGKSYYPLWKRITFIYTPEAISEIAKNPFLRVALMVMSGFYIYSHSHAFLEASRNFVAGRMVPFVINHTSLKVINIYNRALDLLEKTYQYRLNALLCTFVAGNIIRFIPEIPLVSRAIRRIYVSPIWNLLFPTTAASYIVSLAIEGSTVLPDACDNLSRFAEQVAKQNEAQRLALSRQKAFALWKRSFPAIAN